MTGGSGDIGAAICEALAAAGCDVALTYVGNTEGAERTAAAVTAHGRRAHAHRARPARRGVDRRRRGRVVAATSAAATSSSTTRRGTSASRSRSSSCSTAPRGTGCWRPTCAVRSCSAGRWPRTWPPATAGASSTSRRSAGSAPVEQHRLLVLEGRADPPDPLPGRRHGARRLGELRRPRARRGHADGAAPPREVAAGARRQAVLGKVGSAVDIADATVLLCRADTITGQTIVVDGGMPGAMNFG